ncbi:MAG: hypothetical protein IT168_20495 [Bryobacterales bacterium]|nr:hypothetical protein [Bryobacterales bacterium]
MNAQTRRRAIGTMVGGVAAATLAPASAPAGAYTKILLPPASPLPVETAAAELAASTGAEIVRRGHTGMVQAGEIALALGQEVP